MNKSFSFLCFTLFSFNSFAETNARCISDVFVNKDQCPISVNSLYISTKIHNPFDEVKTSNDVLKEKVSKRMLVFFTNNTSLYGSKSTEVFGVDFNKAQVRFGVRKSF